VNNVISIIYRYTFYHGTSFSVFEESPEKRSCSTKVKVVEGMTNEKTINKYIIGIRILFQLVP
jgi:hypothetical protein